MNRYKNTHDLYRLKYRSLTNYTEHTAEYWTSWLKNGYRAVLKTWRKWKKLVAEGHDVVLIGCFPMLSAIPPAFLLLFYPAASLLFFIFFFFFFFSFDRDYSSCAFCFSCVCGSCLIVLCEFWHPTRTLMSSNFKYTWLLGWLPLTFDMQFYFFIF